MRLSEVLHKLQKDQRIRKRGWSKSEYLVTYNGKTLYHYVPDPVTGESYSIEEYKFTLGEMQADADEWEMESLDGWYVYK